ncbi:hypothetical protein niasHT_019250 [Heterodera trifolii]|uniref:Uncharacterized protein n=1 Tax=Heterodera trifolii TaxID=157864 RepID=A0ABD2L0T8_9BILA
MTGLVRSTQNWQCDVLVKIEKKLDFEVVTRLVELYNRKGPLPKTKGQIRIFVLEVQIILLGILEPDGRKLFPPENQRTIIDHKGTQAWAEYFPSGILATPGHQLLRHLFVANSCHDSASASIWLPSPPIRSRGESSWPVPCTRESTQCDVFVVTRLVELYNRKGPLPKTKGQIRIFVLEVQTILLGILEPDGRKLFPPENQRTIIDHKGTQAWAEYFPSGILATPGHQLLRHLFVANSCHDSASASIWLPSPPIRSRGESSWPVPCTRESTQCDVFVVTRLVELYNRKGPLPKTKGQIRIFVLEVQTILLGILEPDGRKLFPPENQRTIIDHKGTQAWAEYFPSGILATPGHHFRFNMAAIASHPKPWRKFVACALHEGIHSM